MHFRVGELYSVEEIHRVLEVGNAGGIRVSLDGGRVRRVVLLTVAPSAKRLGENPYHDRVEGDVLVYSAGGLRGDQLLGGVNRRLAEQPEARFPRYGFRLNQSRRKTGARRWEFLGLLQSLRHNPDQYVDRDGVLRQVWVFEFHICVEIPEVTPQSERASMEAAFAGFGFDAERESRAAVSESPSPIAQVRANAEKVERARAKMIALDPRGFELLVQRTLEATGFIEVSVTRYTQDNGIDVNARVSPPQWPIAGLRVQLQAKRWLHTVGRREVAELRGSLEPLAHGALVTTSYFSKGAVAEANAPGRQPIVLVDGYHFAELADNHRLL